MSQLSRRSFLVKASAVAAGFAGLSLALRRGREAFALDATHSPRASRPHRGFGPLREDPAKILDLPAGFSYTLISRTGEKMDDGLLVPGLHDGMAAFPGPRGLTLLVRNHETNFDSLAASPFGKDAALLAKIDPAKMYDLGHGRTPSLGGTTTLVYDTKAQRLVSHRLSLAGTLRNCAGGPTPWGSWITCEETVVRAGKECEKDHGFNFEVPADAPGLAAPVPLVDMGRFNHEAIAVHPQSSIVYQTEDREDGVIYRFIPNEKTRLAAGGKLQALMAVGKPSLDTRNWTAARTIEPGNPIDVTWIDLDDVASPKDDLRLRAFAAGATRFARGEGMWWGTDAVYFCATTGGTKKLGQVFRYTPSPAEGTPDEKNRPAKLELFIEPNDITLLKNADNICVAPFGDLIVCEDSTAPNRIVGVTPEGHIYPIAKNVMNNSELAGSTFSPDGTTLFFNMQTPGITIAITGPWAELRQK